MTRLKPFRSPQTRATEAAAAEIDPSKKRWSREWIYFTVMMAAWCYIPFIRRLLDYRSGAYNPVQITSLIPFVMVLPLAFVSFKKERLARLTSAMKMFAWIWAAVFVYGFMVAAAFGVISAAGFELIQYLIPMIAGVWIAGQPLPVKQTAHRIALIILPLASVAGVYGVLQWISPPPWDVLWVLGSGFDSAGAPEPFVMRVFSTLNAPGPAADFFTLAILLSLPVIRLKKAWTWPLLGVLGAALLLTLVREAWIGLIFGTILYLIFSPRRFAALPSLAAYAALIVLLITALPVLLGSGPSSDVITARISTLGDVGHDQSALTRQGEITEALQQGLENPMGTGLGTIGAASKLGTNPSSQLGNVLDSGYMARLLTLGWVGCAGYVFVVLGAPFAIVLGIYRAGVAVTTEGREAGAMAVAICGTLAWGDAAADAHLGLNGMFFWIAVGLGSLAVRSITQSVPDEAPKRRPRYASVSLSR
jgi:putative inorganic carbon (HCO3(-)) transporter